MSQLDDARTIANAWRDDPDLKVVALRTGGLTVEEYLISLIAAQDSALYETGEKLRAATTNTTRTEVIEEVAASLETALEWGGAHGQRQRRPNNYGNAARHVRSLK